MSHSSCRHASHQATNSRRTLEELRAFLVQVLAEVRAKDAEGGQGPPLRPQGPG